MPRKPKGRWITEHGYVRLAGGNDGRGVYEHRVVAGEMLGRPLRDGEMVHHKDGNKQNNNPDNLEVMTLDEHNKLHFSNKITIECGFCGREMEIQPSKLKASKSGLMFCNKSCFGKYYYRDGVRGRPFTEEEDGLILKLRNEGLSYQKIGDRLSRHNESIRQRYFRLMERKKDASGT